MRAKHDVILPPTQAVASKSQQSMAKGCKSRGLVEVTEPQNAQASFSKKHGYFP